MKAWLTVVYSVRAVSEGQCLGYLVPGFFTVMAVVLLTLNKKLKFGSLFTQVYSEYDDHNAGLGLKTLRCSNILFMEL